MRVAPRAIRLFSLLLALFASATTSAVAQQPLEVDVELVLLADASGSIDDAEIRFQRDGYAQAITHLEVLSAISKGAYGRIALTFIEWGDQFHQKVVVPWMIVSDLPSAQVFAEKLRSTPRLAYGRNAIGAAISEAQRQIDTNAYNGHRRVIDFSGDSANNWGGMAISEARAMALAAGSIINGLAILCRQLECNGRPIAYDLEQAFATQIIGGPGSFVVTVDSPAQFAEAVRRKFILELAQFVPSRRVATGAAR